MENNIISWVTGKQNIDEVSIQELKDIVRQYPYFTLAQLLLTVKMKRDKNPEYEHQLQKTALNFQDPQWLHFRIAAIESSLGNTIQETSESLEDEETLKNVSVPETKTLDEVTETKIVNAEIEQEEIPTENENASSSEAEAESPVSIDEPETLPNGISTEEIALNSTEEEFEQNESIVENIDTQATAIIQEPNIDTQAQEESDPIEEEKSQEQAAEISESDEPVREKQEEIPVVFNPNIEEIVSENDAPKEALTDELPLEESEVSPSEEEASSRLASVIAAQADVLKQVVQPDQQLPIEESKPLPTKDYFASIGIKVENSSTNDFSKKVKRFSDWLKQMKRVGPEQMIKEINKNEEAVIIQKADDSNKSAEIMTESMAQIYIQQGKKKEAVEILEKLSLLKPEKSAYFASLIDSLKENNQ